MSRDYVSRLVARTLGVGDFVRPRLASRFERARPPIVQRDVEVEPPRTEVEIPAGGRAVHGRAAESAAPPPDEARPPTKVAPSDGVVAKQHGTAERSGAQPWIETKMDLVHFPAHQPDVDEVSDRVGARRPPAAPEYVPEADRAHAGAVTAPTDAPRDVVRRATADEPRRHERVEPVPIVHREMLFPESVALPEIIPPASRHDDAHAPDVSVAGEAEPTIHVTIGRIEVRAAQPVSPPPRARRPPPPTMTLADYLRRRSEG